MFFILTNPIIPLSEYKTLIEKEKKNPINSILTYPCFPHEAVDYLRMSSQRDLRLTN